MTIEPHIGSSQTTGFRNETIPSPCRWNAIKLAAVVAGASLAPSTAAPLPGFTVTKTGDSLIDPQALTISGAFSPFINWLSFQQEALTTHAGYQYLAYYDASRRVCLARRKLPNGPWDIIRFGDYHCASNDAHNTNSTGICPNDGTTHLAFDHHVAPLHYRVSRKGVATHPADVNWEASLFGPIAGELEKGMPVKITYPRFLQTPEGNLQLRNAR